MTQELVTATEQLANALATENAALRALDLPAAGLMLAEKQAATANFAAAQRKAMATRQALDAKALRPAALRLKTETEENRRLLERAIGVQNPRARHPGQRRPGGRSGAPLRPVRRLCQASDLELGFVRKRMTSLLRLRAIAGVMADFNFLLPPGALPVDGGGAYVRSLAAALTAAGHAVWFGDGPGEAIRVVDGLALPSVASERLQGAVGIDPPPDRPRAGRAARGDPCRGTGTPALAAPGRRDQRGGSGSAGC